MTISPLPPGNSAYYGPNGVLLVGGTIVSSIPRTTFPKSLWANPAQTGGVLTNPFTLTTGIATLYGFGSYRQRILDSNGDTISDSVTFGGAQTQTTIVLSTADSAVWTVPAGVYLLYVEVVGAGGAGSNCLAPTIVFDVSGGGGGAGGFANGTYAVIPGQPISYSVGAGGASADQANGLASNFGTFINCGGGAGSSFLVQGTSVGGVGGTATGGTIMNLTGGGGTDGSHIPIGGGGLPYRGSGNGGQSFYGAGGTAVNGANGNNGLAPGSGGGGAMDVNLTNITFNGGAGADGQILITYWG